MRKLQLEVSSVSVKMKFLATVLVTVCLVKFSYQLPYGVKGSSNYPSSSAEVQYIHGTESQFGNTVSNQGVKGYAGATANGGGPIIFRPDNEDYGNGYRSGHSGNNQGFESSSSGVYNSGGHESSKGIFGSKYIPISNNYGPSSSVGIISEGHGSSGVHTLANGPVSNGYGPSSSVGTVITPSGQGSSYGQEVRGFSSVFEPSSQSGRHGHNHQGGHGKKILNIFTDIHDKLITGFITQAGGHSLSNNSGSQRGTDLVSVGHGVKGGYGSSVGSLPNNNAYASNSNSYATSNSYIYSGGSNNLATANAGSSGHTNGPSYG